MFEYLKKIITKLNLSIVLSVAGLVLALAAFYFDIFGFSLDRQEARETTAGIEENLRRLEMLAESQVSHDVVFIPGEPSDFNAFENLQPNEYLVRLNADRDGRNACIVLWRNNLEWQAITRIWPSDSSAQSSRYEWELYLPRYDSYFSFLAYENLAEDDDDHLSWYIDHGNQEFRVPGVHVSESRECNTSPKFESGMCLIVPQLDTETMQYLASIEIELMSFEPSASAEDLVFQAAEPNGELADLYADRVRWGDEAVEEFDELFSLISNNRGIYEAEESLFGTLRSVTYTNNETNLAPINSHNREIRRQVEQDTGQITITGRRIDRSVVPRSGQTITRWVAASGGMLNIQRVEHRPLISPVRQWRPSPDQAIPAIRFDSSRFEGALAVSQRCETLLNADGEDFRVNVIAEYR